jgi:hypothetical protein
MRNCDQIHRPTSDIITIAITPSTTATAIAHMVELPHEAPTSTLATMISLWAARTLIYIKRSTSGREG